jgi:magnesium-transporting ATPase (P-type)
MRGLAANFAHPLALLLWFGATMAFAARAAELALAIVAVIVINGLFAFLQERRTQRVVEALLARAALTARVLRDGVERVVPAAQLVKGDRVVLAAGDVVPADCELLADDTLSLDVSLLTGETTPVAELDGRVPAGAGVIRGTATGVVVATADESALGRIATLLAGPGRGESVLARQVAELSRTTAAIAVIAGAATLSLAIAWRGTDVVVALTFATGVIVALVPEGLLPLLTTSLAMAARRMAARGALVRRLGAVEDVGATTVICTDKTGTLTQNTLAVLGFVAAPEASDAMHRAHLVAALCNDARDPIDRALAAWSMGAGVDPAVARADHPRASDVAFDADLRYMRVDCVFAGGTRQLVKGAPEAIAVLTGAPLPPALAGAIDDAAARGERVLLLAEGPAGEAPAYVGLVRLHDPPRPEVPAAIAACRRAGIRVIMLTGDHPATARAVAEKVGLCDGDEVVLEGQDLDALDERRLVERLRGPVILARTKPEQKLRVVRALRAAGEVVTVTGDGVNDAPALRVADVGIAMGLRGTEVAKQASDIVLLDDNFATIVAAVEEGRAIKRNIRRFASYVFASNVSELVPFLAYVFCSLPLPLTILQVLAIDLGTDLLPALALGVERPSPRTLDRPPEPARSPLLTPALAIQTFLFFGSIEAALGMAGFLLGPADAGTTMTFLGILGGQVGYLFTRRGGGFRARLSLTSNPWIGVGIAVELALALVLVYVPVVGAPFSMQPVAPVWLLIVPLAAAVMIVADVVRRYQVSPA